MVKITIITVCYNAESVIEDTIRSILGQTYSNVEFIVIDGGSKDATISIINKYYNRISKVLSEPDNGIYDAMNKGIALATGDYINFMNAGDTFYSDNVLVKVAEKTCGIDVLFGDKAIVKDGVVYRDRAKPFYEHLPLHHSMGFNHQCTFVKTELAKKYPFDQRYKLAADYNMIIELYRHSCTFMQLDLIVANFDLKGVSNTNQYLHLYERLMIDCPNKPLINSLKAHCHVYKRKLVCWVRDIIFRVCPYLINKYRENKKQFTKISKL